MAMEERDFITLAQGGNREAFGEIYEKYSDKIYRYIYYRIFHKETAEDLTGQVFMKTLQSLSAFDVRRGAFSAWIYRIARNTLFDHLRTEKKHIDFSELVASPDEPLHSAHTDLARDLDRRELLRKVQKYLSELSDEQRDIILMRVWDEMSFKEIAAVLGKKEGATQMAFSRATAKIRKEVLVALLLLLITNAKI